MKNNTFLAAFLLGFVVFSSCCSGPGKIPNSVSLPPKNENQQLFLLKDYAWKKSDNKLHIRTRLVVEIDKTSFVPCQDLEKITKELILCETIYSSKPEIFPAFIFDIRKIDLVIQDPELDLDDYIHDSNTYRDPDYFTVYFVKLTNNLAEKFNKKLFPEKNNQNDIIFFDDKHPPFILDAAEQLEELKKTQFIVPLLPVGMVIPLGLGTPPTGNKADASGIIIFESPYLKLDTLAHEFGHWGGNLMHVFNQPSDYVDDTKDGTMEELANYNNIMNYGDFENPEITKGQLERFSVYFSVFRRSYLMPEE